MCGIAGLIVARNVDDLRARCTAMVNSIRYRGPDGSGVFNHAGVALGHARLAIVDLSDGAAQPMVDKSGQYAIVFNGEIYNYREIRGDLVSLGHRFRTSSDTEVLLVAYEVWGDRFVEKLNGMFAFALFDIKKSQILLARDRLGIKPLYWSQQAGEISFASEIKAIAVASKGSLSVDPHAVLEYLSFQNYLGGDTLFSGVKLVPAGTVITINTNNLQVYKRVYWSAVVQPQVNSEADAKKQIDKALNAAVNRQMQADVEVSSFLSGGIDSCAIAAIGSKSAGRIKTFTCGFGLNGVTEAESQFDERLAAESVAARLGSEHYETVLNSQDFLARMHDWAWHAEEPRVGSSFPNFCVAGLASKFTKVCLSGAGGDELFGGYPWRYQAALKASDRHQFVREYYNFWHRMMSPEDHALLTRPIAGQMRYDSFAIFDERMRTVESRTAASDSPRADATLIFEMETFLQGLLIVEDKASMAHGLEVRVPLLDNELIDIALATPFRFKVSQDVPIGVTSTGGGQLDLPSYSNGKKILRQVLSNYVSPASLAGRKQGFSPPFETWFREGLRPWIDAEVFGSQSVLADLIDLRTARQLWVDHIKGFKNNRLFVWGMVSLYLALTSFSKQIK